MGRSEGRKMGFCGMEKSYVVREGVLVVVGDKGDWEWERRGFYEGLGGKEKEVFVVGGYCDMEVYEKGGGVGGGDG